MEICGYQLECKENATVTVNKRLLQGERVPSDEIPRYPTMGRLP